MGSPRQPLDRVDGSVGGISRSGALGGHPVRSPTADAEDLEFVDHIGGAASAVALQETCRYIGKVPRLTVENVSNPLPSNRKC